MTWFYTAIFFYHSMFLTDGGIYFICILVVLCIALLDVIIIFLILTIYHISILYVNVNINQVATFKSLNSYRKDNN